MISTEVTLPYILIDGTKSIMLGDDGKSSIHHLETALKKEIGNYHKKAISIGGTENVKHKQSYKSTKERLKGIR